MKSSCCNGILKGCQPLYTSTWATPVTAALKPQQSTFLCLLLRDNSYQIRQVFKIKHLITKLISELIFQAGNDIKGWINLNEHCKINKNPKQQMKI